MNLHLLYKILHDTTVQLRKGDMVRGAPHLVEAVKEGRDLSKEPGGVVIIDGMPHVSEADDGIEKVDCHFIVIGVDKAKAEQHRAEFIEILRTYPDPSELAGGPSYLHVGGRIGDQGAAFQMFALGQTLGLWRVLTPATMGFRGEEADQMAGMGFVMCSGWRQ